MEESKKPIDYDNPPPENVIRIECKDGSSDYIEIVFDRPVAEIDKQIEEEKRRRRLWYRIKRLFKRKP
ncbi:hypothetical protein [Helicobacter vulpis]|uniref:hypothetical protein n=1 Tax=Helicobacter vulpis TaxID=2316076 RepID=UPI000EB1CE2E|nr:hypothetical protein [Helicobacter vulpis]